MLRAPLSLSIGGRAAGDRGDRERLMASGYDASNVSELLTASRHCSISETRRDYIVIINM